MKSQDSQVRAISEPREMSPEQLHQDDHESVEGVSPTLFSDSSAATESGSPLKVPRSGAVSMTDADRPTHDQSRSSCKQERGYSPPSYLDRIRTVKRSAAKQLNVPKIGSPIFSLQPKWTDNQQSKVSAFNL
jgi:hypothetical protein